MYVCMCSRWKMCEYQEGNYYLAITVQRNVFSAVSACRKIITEVDFCVLLCRLSQQVLLDVTAT